MSVEHHSAVDPSYYEDGASWERDTYRQMRASRLRAWCVAGAACLITLIALVALLLLLPLKQFAPYVITVDRSSGYVELAPSLAHGEISQDEAITQANLVQYVIKRETYDPATNQDFYHHVTLFSEEKALQSFQQLWSRAHPANPASIYGDRAQVRITIKSITFLNDRTAAVRFLRRESEANRSRDGHYVALLSFRYVNKPTRLKDRFTNPLGFVVSSYRVDQEFLEE